MPSVPLQSAAVQTLLALFLGIRLTAFRGQSFSADGVFESASFLKWHKAQTNSAEYHGIFIGMCALLKFGWDSKGVEPSKGTNVACAMSAISSVLFAIGVIVGKSVGANPTGRGPTEQPHPLRALGAIGRYVAMLLMAKECYQLSQMSSKPKAALTNGKPSQKDELKQVEKELKEMINKLNCNPILVRLAWHDSGTYDQRIKSFPECGGANGAIRFDPEMNMGANAGLDRAKKYLDEIHVKHPSVSWADLIQMGSAVAVECAGGPKIPMKYGRVSVTSPEECVGPTSREGFGGNAGLPDAKPDAGGNFGCGAKDAATHLRNVFTKKMGFNDQEIVALSGAHTIGRAFKDRSGTCPFGYLTPSNYTKHDCIVRKDGAEGVGMSGGCAWTKNWLTFDNSYFKDYKTAEKDEHLLWFPTDTALHTDSAFKPTFEKYAADQKAFFNDYAKAHKKLSELGCKFEPAEGITL